MKQLRTSRFWLLTTAALIFGSHMSASAQSSTVFQPGNYQVGAPTTVAAAPSLPNISADQIARDVTAEFNPRTGQTELIAATFDPFEDDPNLAGSLRLRSADGAVAINGQPLAGGALVEVDFYYNSPSDDPYGGRNYSDVSFVSGDLAPVVLRDTRILECSSRVDNVVYDHNVYYSPPAYYSPQVSNFGIYQPYRHYTGHSSFGFGFGSNYFGPGINFFNDNSRSRRNFGTSRAFLPRTNLPNGGFRRGFVRQGRIITPVGPGTAVVGETNNGPVSTPTAQTNTLTPLAAAAARQRRDIRNRISGRRLSAEDFLPAATPALNTQPVAATATSTTGISSAQANTQSNSATSSAQQRAADIGLSRRAILRGRTGLPGSRRAIPKQSTSTPVVPKQTAPGRVIPKQTRTTPVISKQSSSTPKQSSSRRATTPKRSSSSSSRSSSSRSSSSSSRSSSPRSSSSSRRSSPRSSSSSRRSSSSSIRSRRLNFFPSSSHGGQSIVTSQSVDCAREDKLSVFIPNDRLDAARFDGLTLIALDAQGGETPIYIPPNYIEGYRLAATGRVQPQGITPAPQPQISPQIQPQPPLIEPAPCPAGALKQPDGTCLLTSETGYPTQ